MFWIVTLRDILYKKLISVKQSVNYFNFKNKIIYDKRLKSGKAYGAPLIAHSYKWKDASMPRATAIRLNLNNYQAL